MRCAPSLLVALALLWPGGCIIVTDDDDDSAGGESGPVAEGGTAADDTGTGACFDPPQCDPLAPNCVQSKCIPNDGVFACTPGSPAQEFAEGEACDGALSCQAGLVCLPGAGTCTGGEGCCTALCDLAQPQCPSGTACTAYFGEAPPPCYADVGVCLAG